MYGSISELDHPLPAYEDTLEESYQQNISQPRNRWVIVSALTLCLTVGVVISYASYIDATNNISPSSTVSSFKEENTLTGVSADDTLSDDFEGEPSTLTGITALTNAVRTNVNPPANPALPM